MSVVTISGGWPQDGRAFTVELAGGVYQEAARVSGNAPFRTERPFPVEIVPAQLVAKLRVG